MNKGNHQLGDATAQTLRNSVEDRLEITLLVRIPVIVWLLATRCVDHEQVWDWTLRSHVLRETRDVHHHGELRELVEDIAHSVQRKRVPSNSCTRANYRHYIFVLIRKQYGGKKIKDVTVVTDLIENSIGKIMVGCWRCMHPSIHFFMWVDTL